MQSRLLALALVGACHGPSTTTVSWHPPVEVASGGGTKGEWQQNDSDFDYVDDPSVALLADGSAAVVWADHRDKDIHFARFDARGQRTGENVNISRTAAVFSWHPRIVVHGRDVFVVWQEIVFSGGTHGGEIMYAHSRDGGASFSPVLNLSRSTGGDGKGRIDARTWHNGSLAFVRAPGGELHVAWTEYDGALWFTSSRDGETFSAPTLVAGTHDLPARAPSLAANERDLYLAWSVGENESADIHVARFDDERFGAPILVARTPTYSDTPQLALDDSSLHIVYSESRGGPTDRMDVVYTRLVGQTFMPPLVLGEGGFPSLALDDGRVTVVWERSDHRGLMVSTGALGRFSPARLVDNSRDDEGTNGSHQGRLTRKIAKRGSSIAVVNSALAPGKHSRVWLMRGELHATR